MTIRNVTVGIDGSPGSEGLLRWADDLAGRAGGRLRVVTTWHLPYFAASADAIAVAPPVAEIEEQTNEALRNLVDAAPRSSHVDVVVGQGSATRILIDLSSNDDLLVVGRRGAGRFRGLGSTSRHCAIHGCCPVAVVPADAAALGESPRLAVAVDGSRASAGALAWALNNFAGSEVTAMNSEGRHGAAAKHVLASTVAAAHEIAQLDWPVATLALSGDPRTTILEAAREHDLLVVGDRGHGVPGLLLGSFATYAVGHAPSPLPVIVARSAR
jgi:nucleotide-binding universal stress UspA family protein